MTEEPRAPIELEIAPEEAGERLDRALAARGLGLSRSKLQQLIEQGHVLVDGAPARVRDKVRAGMHVRVVPAQPPSRAIAEDLPLQILFEDPQVLVVNKAAGMVVHPAPGHTSGTLVNALRFHRELLDDHGATTERPGIVHRLDKDTSGVMIVAKTAAAREGLVAQFKAHELEREYLAIVLGHPGAAFTLDTLHGRHPRDRKRFTTKVAAGKRAVTHVRVLQRLHGASLVSCTLATGRTHQIRVHLAEHGHPVLADPVYGRRSRDARVEAAAAAIGRQALHARVLGLRHPTTLVPLRFVAEPPDAFAQALSRLRD